MEKIIGRPLRRSEEVHHKDEDRSNNDPENLELCESRQVHALRHIEMRAYEACGDPSKRLCYLCREYDTVDNMRGYDRRGGAGGALRYVHPSCAREKVRTDYYRRKQRA